MPENLTLSVWQRKSAQHQWLLRYTVTFCRNLERMGDHCCNIARSMMKMTADHTGDDKHLNPRLDDNKQR
ncbi:MAG: PhoU domain-containing protein [Erysipelotrichaceae bacterium]|nr:PhoU domain-containing protein [Erysipelotrichaceae bacterium]